MKYKIVRVYFQEGMNPNPSDVFVLRFCSVKAADKWFKAFRLPDSWPDSSGYRGNLSVDEYNHIIYPQLDIAPLFDQRFFCSEKAAWKFFKNDYKTSKAHFSIRKRTYESIYEYNKQLELDNFDHRYRIIHEV